MMHFPPRFGALALVVAVGFGSGLPIALVSNASAQTSDAVPVAASPPAVVSASPAAADQNLAARMVDASATGRHLAPHDTFYVLTYVSVRTSKGVEGFDPGQEVHLVEVHRPTHTLVVTDGHAQVEVAPTQLTNDMDIAAMVRRKDEASQARIAAHIQAEQAAYNQFEREAADTTAQDLAQRRRQQQQAAEVAAAQEQPRVTQTPVPADDQANGNGNGYYGYGGYGYGSPFSYFSGSSESNVAPRNNAPGSAAASGAAPAGGRAANPATVGTAGRPPR